MKSDCEVIRDLLPLYVDDICSGKSRELVDEHLAECSECSKMLNQLKCTEIEAGLKHEKQDVISYGKEQFKKLSARTGITASGLFMIPIAALLAINLIAGCGVIDGKVQRNARVRVLRDGVVVYTGKIGSLKRFKDDAKEVLAGFECGIGVENFNDIKVGDQLEAFVMDEVEATL